jgi:hypothetical protein
LEKRLQTAENKRAECEKESQENTRGGKLLRTQDLPQKHGEAVEMGAQKPQKVHPHGDRKYAQRAESRRDIDATWRI